jgi:hypothetical protein
MSESCFDKRQNIVLSTEAKVARISRIRAKLRPEKYQRNRTIVTQDLFRPAHLIVSTHLHLTALI